MRSSFDYLSLPLTHALKGPPTKLFLHEPEVVRYAH